MSDQQQPVATGDPQDVVMGAGGPPSVSWVTQMPDGSRPDKPVGTTVVGYIDGEITSRQQTDYDTQEPLTWRDGKPRMMVGIPLQTDLNEWDDDDGRRTLWVRQSTAMQASLKDAIQKAGATWLEKGGMLQVTFTGTRPAQNPKNNPVKQFSIIYTPPAPQAQQAVMGDGAQTATVQGNIQYGQASQPQAQQTTGNAVLPQAQPQQPQVQQQPAQAPPQAPPQQSTPAPAQVQIDPNQIQVINQLRKLGQSDEQIAQATGMPLTTVSMVPPF